MMQCRHLSKNPKADRNITDGLMLVARAGFDVSDTKAYTVLPRKGEDLTSTLQCQRGSLSRPLGSYPRSVG